MLDTFEKFLGDKEAWDMYISGAAGTGKTTSLAKLLAYCEEREIPTLVCAHTHKACEVIREKTPPETKVSTLHSFLNKRPGINDEATDSDRISFIAQLDVPDATGVLFIDEYSMVADIDMCDIRVCQDPDYIGDPKVKVVYIGDPNQLPPVGEPVAVRPVGDYCVYLTKIWRQENDSQLKNTLTKLIKYIEGSEKPAFLQPNDNFIRDADLASVYEDMYSSGMDPRMLCYTNEAVQRWNRELEGLEEPRGGSIVWSPHTREDYEFETWTNPENIQAIDLPRERILALGTKYKTLEFLLKMKDIQFARMTQQDTHETYTFAYVFGHYNYKIMKEKLGKLAVEANKEIENKIGLPSKNWAKQNPKHPLARKRAKAWRDFLCFDDCVICLDFAHATTIHKSQGSTYDNVCVDSKDLERCTDTNTLLRLWYVALSRAKYNVYVNN
jgi:hypothetical protein